jgi:ABC-type nitrate/sulfonate/bicarbonate transport system permease component
MSYSFRRARTDSANRLERSQLRLSLLRIVVSPILAVMAWETFVWVAGWFLEDTLTIPSLLAGFRYHELSNLVTGLREHLAPTMLRWVVMFVASIASGTIIGLLVGMCPGRLRHVLVAAVDFLRSIPATALFTIFMAIVGDQVARLLPPAYVAFFSAAFFSANATSTSLAGRLGHLRSLGASRTFVVRHCLFLEVVDILALGCRHTVSISFVILVSTELLVGAPGAKGLGWLMYDYKQQFLFVEQAALLLVLGLIGVVLNEITSLLTSCVAFWRTQDAQDY